mmetsp:Transcript_13234/g.40093  ORF Transcript_13234/g.40093 Transcript_13234/m.40093 type:complete len:153 (+) Transcript_13234:64-522(+)|eukprot:CAMPEP_0206134614 /NCGR_PEP_ID=MMETSP1473-20131121/110_1 /ASSEMBLY_ACC=CAM_ASM_001109 /TAXON_ID=1461547 /ORGANISM="Stichococcus sp, Strain RCC1054" /LENGTH=152 /DNA_ID=CAMNT_0053526231 /DNA_START=46 /DNA_END=504 /DNA_ORIENTATION=+
MSLLNTILGRGSSSADSSPVSSPHSQQSPPTSPSSSKSPKVQGSNVWQSVFNPGRNYSAVSQRKSIDKYDHVHRDDDNPKTMWEQILKSQNLSRLSTTFSSIDKDGDGYLGADDLKAAFPKGADVHRLIDSADTNKDGKISLEEFKKMMRDS